MPDDEQGLLLLPKNQSRNSDLNHNLNCSKKRYVLVAVNATLTVISQSTGILLVRFYYSAGGSNMWLITLAQTAAFPLLIPIIIVADQKNPLPYAPEKINVTTLASIYIVLGSLFGGSNIMFTKGLLYLSASTYSLICSTQLAFVAIFSLFINSQPFTPLIINSVTILSLSAALIAFDSDDNDSSESNNYIIGILMTLLASAMYSLFFSLTQLSFQRVFKRETFSTVIEMQAYVSLVATIGSIVGLFASGDWIWMDGFSEGRLYYALTLVLTALTWQVFFVCSTGLIFLVSSLFSTVISTLSLAVNPIAAMVVFHDRMSGVKVIAFLMAIWGFVSYVYQSYLDESKAIESNSDLDEPQTDSSS